MDKIDNYSFLKLKYINKDKLNKGSIEDFNKKLEGFCTEKHFKHVMTKKDFFESKNVKELCRAGIPFKYFKDVTLKLFNFTNDDTIEHFTIRRDKVFKGIEVKDVGNYVPYFTGNNLFEESFNYDILTEEGILSVKEIQWMLNSVIPTIEHSPILIKLNALLHFLLEPYEVYSLLRTLINMNYNKTDLHKLDGI